MKQTDFDREILRRVEREDFQVNPKIEETLRRTLQNPQTRREAKKITLRGLALAFAAVLLLCGAAFALSGLRPKPDHTVTALGQSGLITEADASYIADFSAASHCLRMVCQTTLQNPTDTPVLLVRRIAPVETLENWARVDTDASYAVLQPHSSQSFQNVIYLPDKAFLADANVRMSLTVDAYPIPQFCDAEKADGEAALEAAFAEGKVLLSGGDVILPASYAQAHPDAAALAYYEDEGLIALASTESRQAALAVSAIPLALLESSDVGTVALTHDDGFTFRLLPPELGAGSAYVLLDVQFESSAAVEALDTADYPGLVWRLETQASDGNWSILSAEAALNGDSGLWTRGGELHRTYFCILAWTQERPKNLRLVPVVNGEALYERALPVEEPAAPSAFSTQEILARTDAFQCEITYSSCRWQYGYSVANPTEQTLFVSWRPLLDPLMTNSVEIISPDSCTMLRPGSGIDGNAVGYLFEGCYHESTAKMGVEVIYYTAAPGTVIFEQESDGSDSGSMQREAREEAFAQGKMLVTDWVLALPDSYAQAHPDETPLDYYLSRGMLDRQTRWTESVECTALTPEEEMGDGAPLAQAEGEGFTARLMRAELLDEAPYMVVDLLFDSKAARDEFTREHSWLNWLPAANEQGSAVSRGSADVQRWSSCGENWTDAETGEVHRTYIYMAERVPLGEAIPLRLLAAEKNEIALGGMELKLAQLP